MTFRYNEINQHDALYVLARAYPGGVEALAQRMGRSPNVLYNKLRPQIETHRVTFEEATEIAELCFAANVPDAERHFDAAEARLGRVAYRLPQLDSLTDVELSNVMLQAVGGVGDIATALHDAFANDGKIDDDEMAELEKHFIKLSAVQAEWHARIRARHEADKTPPKKAPR
jgi:hypothetical protein